MKYTVEFAESLWFKYEIHRGGEYLTSADTLLGARWLIRRDRRRRAKLAKLNTRLVHEEAV